MLNSMPTIVLVSTILGFLSGLGVGGGSILILWLTMVIGMEQSAARIINLFFFLPAAIISVTIHYKKGSVSIQRVLPGILAGVFCAAAATIIAKKLDPLNLRKGFGFLLIITGTRELFYKPSQRLRKAR